MEALLDRADASLVSIAKARRDGDTAVAEQELRRVSLIASTSERLLAEGESCGVPEPLPPATHDVDPRVCEALRSGDRERLKRLATRHLWGHYGAARRGAADIAEWLVSQPCVVWVNASDALLTSDPPMRAVNLRVEGEAGAVVDAAFYVEEETSFPRVWLREE